MRGDGFDAARSGRFGDFARAGLVDVEQIDVCFFRGKPSAIARPMPEAAPVPALSLPAKDSCQPPLQNASPKIRRNRQRPAIRSNRQCAGLPPENRGNGDAFPNRPVSQMSSSLAFV